MNIIDIIAIIPYFITLATVVAEEEDTLNLPKAPVSPQVCIFHLRDSYLLIPNEYLQTLLTHFQSNLGQVNESGYVLSNFAGDTFSSSVPNI